jgi:hypothetical protein
MAHASCPPHSIPEGDLYENHYSRSQNGCVDLLHQTTLSRKAAKSSPGVSLVQGNLLYDVPEKAQLGAFVVKDLKEVTACNVSGMQCTTNEEWMRFAWPDSLSSRDPPRRAQARIPSRGESARLGGPTIRIR